MKKNNIPAIVVLILGLVIAVGSQTFLGACVHEDGSFGACHWASRAIMGVGGLMAVLALLALTVPGAGKRAGLYLAMLPTAALGLLTPGTLIDLCMMDTMRCRALMRPATTILFALSLVAAIAGLLLARKEAR
ncbi:MAG: DUF4418 family protein [Clostridia bacterium]|nr:DUF4418 family protein [Clostridia bacterium]